MHISKNAEASSLPIPPKPIAITLVTDLPGFGLLAAEPLRASFLSFVALHHPVTLASAVYHILRVVQKLVHFADTAVLADALPVFNIMLAVTVPALVAIASQLASFIAYSLYNCLLLTDFLILLLDMVRELFDGTIFLPQLYVILGSAGWVRGGLHLGLGLQVWTVYYLQVVVVVQVVTVGVYACLWGFSRCVAHICNKSNSIRAWVDSV